MKVNAANLAKALEAMNWVIKQPDAPEGLKYRDLFDARINILVALKGLEVKVEEAEK